MLGSRKNSIILFSGLTIIFSWTFWALGYVIFPDSFILQLPFLRLGAFAPALVSVLLCTFDKSGNKTGLYHKKRLRIFIITWILATIHIIIYLYAIEDVDPSLLSIGVSIVTSLLPAFMISRIYSRNNAVRKHMSSIIRSGKSIKFLIISFFLIPSVLVCDLFLNMLIGNNPSINFYGTDGPSGFLLILLILLIAQSLQAGGLSEEPGWRGFALRNLQYLFSPLISGLIVGMIWGLWHFPMFIPQIKEVSPLMILYNCSQLGILFTWVYNKSHGDLLSVILLHASWNVAADILPKSFVSDLIIGMILIYMIFSDKMWRRITPASETKYQSY